jgi:hypothetical protein
MTYPSLIVLCMYAQHICSLDAQYLYLYECMYVRVCLYMYVIFVSIKLKVYVCMYVCMY